MLAFLDFIFKVLVSIYKIIGKIQPYAHKLPIKKTDEIIVRPQCTNPEPTAFLWLLRSVHH